MLVPLTNTLYVPGKLVKPDELLVDVGAGYFVPKSVPGATELLQKKVDMVTKQGKAIQDQLR